MNDTLRSNAPKLRQLALLLIAAAVSSLPIHADEPPAFPVLDWKAVGHGGGGYHQVLSPAPTQPNRLYLGIDVGGIYRSDNGGESWYPIYGSLKYVAHHAQRCQDIAVSHQNPDVFYTITSYAGMWRSRDGGHSYDRVGEMTTTGGKRGGQHIVINPADHNDVVFFANSQFYRTTDGGKSLTALGLPKNVDGAGAAAAKFGADGKTLRLWVGDNPVYRSDDAGKTWQAAKMTGWPGGEGYRGEHFTRRILWTSRDAKSKKPVLFMASKKPLGSIYRSDDAGDSWRAISPPMDGDKPYYAIDSRGDNLSIWVDPSDANRLAVNSWPEVGHMTRDGGKNWHVPRPLPMQRARYPEALGVDMHANAYVFVPGHPNRVYARTMFTVYRSDDGGKNFYVVSQRRLGQHHYMDNGENGVYANLAFTDPNTGHLYLSDNDVGLARSEDFGRSWHMLRYPVTEPKDSGHPLGGSGRSIWNTDCLAGWFFEPGEPSKLYAWINQSTVMPSEAEYFSRIYSPLRKGRRGIYTTTNGGASFQPRSRYETFPFNWVGVGNAMAVDTNSPQQARVFYIAVASGVFKSEDSGRTWTCLNDNIGKSLNKKFPDFNKAEEWKQRDSIFIHVRITRTNPATLYATTLFRNTGHPDSRLPAIIQSKDGGTTWSAVRSPIQSCWQMSVSPHHDDWLYAADRDKGLFASKDAGKTWRHVFDLTHITNIVPSRREKNLVFVASDAGYRWNPRAGVFRSADDGKSWTDITGNLPHLRIMHLSEDALRPHWLTVGTRGGGAFMAYDFVK